MLERSATTPERSQTTPQALLSLYRPDIAQALGAMDVPSYRHAQALDHLLHRPLRPFDEATALPAGTRAALSPLEVSTLALVETTSSSDGTTKLLLSARDGACLESVLIRYRERLTVCLSSQVGCPVACGFCATGAMGFHRNLSAAEMVDQVLTASAIATAEGLRVSNVVHMGMGEPLLNLGAVIESIRILTHPCGFGLAQRAISVSTIGIPRGIRSLARAEPQVNLAISLHAADDRTRALLVPKRCRYPIREILEAAWDHFDLTRRKLLIEYILLAGINDSVEDARRLASLLKGHVVTVNLLAWNPVRDPASRRERPGLRTEAAGAASLSFRPSNRAAMSTFRQTLLSAHIEAVVRRSKGSDVEAACGQLAGRRRSHDKHARSARSEQ
ncbi:MAG: 23S rRNA (adenine(2503)-C(2))-methyltransferase [Acidobacteria bacterium RBG_16_64_8]|nr:MAG: 23S rRNA (adenine(2503)-C(2))-methyltransferase [Acidobacteria bacterium RBG_16_64_8]